MIGLRVAAALALAAAFVGCTSTAPYPTAPAKSVLRDLSRAQPGPAGRRALAFCYNSQVNAPEELLAEARRACSAGEVRYAGTDLLWTPCGLFQPARATFICTPTPSAEAPAVQ